MQTELMFSREDSPANHIALPEQEKAKRMNATYGQRCLEQFEKFPRVGSWAKTFAALLIGTEDWYSTRCKLTWSLRGTKYCRFYFLLLASTPHTNEIEFGLSLLKTPTAMDGEVASGKKNPVSGNSGTLAQEIMSGYKPTMIKLGFLPTPRSSENENRQTKLSPSQIAGRRGLSLAALAAEGFLPTPLASGCGEKVTGLETQNSLTKIARNITGKTSQLNPRFVAEMMGFPVDWLESPFLIGEDSPSNPTATQLSPE